ncbi:hypothetical protein EON80_23045 [bacterium]|nr:MAG: hypothetical protein EON80_23045 [bacterium]
MKIAVPLRLSFFNALVFALAMVGRTLLFVSNFHALGSANVIGWPFAAALFFLAFVGTIIGIVASIWAVVVARKTNMAWRPALLAMGLNGLLLPLAYFLTFIIPFRFMSGVSFD